jgi:Tripartite ATP-independent periplasmic transporters, DctQ component
MQPAASHSRGRDDQMTDAGATERPLAQVPLVERLSGTIAILGGLLSLAMATLVVISVLGRWLAGMDWARAVADRLGITLGPINGDFEMVQIATALAIFAFLPYAQARRANIVVDTFTGMLPRRATAIIDAFWDLVYAGVMGVLAAALIAGALDHYRSGQTTMLLQIIIWPAIALSAVLLMLLTCVALATALRLIRGRS